MDKPRFLKVGLDTPTYEKLGRLAQSRGLSRAACVRVMIIDADQALRRGKAGGVLAGAPLDADQGVHDDSIITMREDGPRTMAELSMAERLVTRFAMLAGVEIDTGFRKKLRRFLIEAMMPDLDAEAER